MQIVIHPIADSYALVGATAFALAALVALLVVRARSSGGRWVAGLLGGATVVAAVVAMLRPGIEGGAELFYDPVTGSYFTVGAIAAALAALLMLVGPGRTKTSPARRAVLAVVRTLVILLVVLAMLRPELVYTEIKKDKATLVVLADTSRSLTIQDGLSGKSRWESLRQTLEEAVPALREVGREFEIKAYTFDAETHAAEIRNGKITLPNLPEGDQTGIGPTLEDVTNLEGNKRLLGIVILTDGRQQARPPRDTAPVSAAGRLYRQAAPVYAVVFGQSRGLGAGQDVAVRDLWVSPHVFVKNELEVTGQIRVDGYVNREIPVRVLFEIRPGEMEVVAQQKIKATRDGETVPVQFRYTVPDVAGEHKVILEAAPQPGEQVTANNEQSRFVTVLKGGLRVLYIEGVIRPEAKFIRRALDASQDIKLDYLRVAPRRPETKPSKMDDLFKPGKYDVYILGDMDASVFRDNPQDEHILEALAQAVDRGAGLIMLGGMNSFGAGHYAETPLAKVSPIRMDRLEVQPLGEPIREDLHLPGPLRMVPSEFGAEHFVLQLSSDPRDNAKLWGERLPPLDGANRFERSKLDPRAVVLGEKAGGNPDSANPLLVSKDSGSGRVLAFAGDSTWRWVMHGFDSEHKRFWRQIVLWLAHKEQVGEGKVWVRVENRQVNVGDRVEFSAGTMNVEGGAALKDVEFQTQIIGPPPKQSRTPGLLVPHADRMAGTFRDTQAPGDYLIELKASYQGKSLGEARARFSVSARDLELDNPAADPDTMEAVAKMTGGKTVAPEQLPDLIRQLARNTQYLESKQETKKSLWDTWAMFSMLVGLLSVEWYLRKRWGLV